jgi:hypothetical protein
MTTNCVLSPESPGLRAGSAAAPSPRRGAQDANFSFRLKASRSMTTFVTNWKSERSSFRSVPPPRPEAPSPGACQTLAFHLGFPPRQSLTHSQLIPMQRHPLLALTRRPLGAPASVPDLPQRTHHGGWGSQATPDFSFRLKASHSMTNFRKKTDI